MLPKALAFCCLALLLLSASFAAQTCSPTTAVPAQSRTELKHRATPTRVAATPTSVADMLGWPAPDKIGLKATRESEQPIDPREGQVFTLEGNLWRVGLEGNDCDYHLEIAGVRKGKAAQRVIAEIPPEDTTGRQQLLSLLPAATREKLLNAEPDSKGNYRKLNLTAAVPIKVTGYAFFDGHHYTANWRNSKGGSCHFTPAQVQQRGNSHGTCYVGTIWELHPVWDVKAGGE